MITYLHSITLPGCLGTGTGDWGAWGLVSLAMRHAGSARRGESLGVRQRGTRLPRPRRGPGSPPGASGFSLGRHSCLGPGYLPGASRCPGAVGLRQAFSRRFARLDAGPWGFRGVGARASPSRSAKPHRLHTYCENQANKRPTSGFFLEAKPLGVAGGRWADKAEAQRLENWNILGKCWLVFCLGPYTSCSSSVMRTSCPAP